MSKKQNRLIYTKINNKPSFLIMSCCNLCPFMRYDYDNNLAMCGRYIDPLSISKINNVLEPIKLYKFINETKKISYDNINIPIWCNLTKQLNELNENGTIFTTKNGILFSESGALYNNDKNDIRIFFDSEIQFDRNNSDLLIIKPVMVELINSSYNKSYENYDTEYDIIDDNICSCCGKSVDSVDREKNNGMCNDCWSSSKNDLDVLYNSHINNFRLKRRKPWKNCNFKKIKIF